MNKFIIGIFGAVLLLLPAAEASAITYDSCSLFPWTCSDSGLTDIKLDTIIITQPTSTAEEDTSTSSGNLYYVNPDTLQTIDSVDVQNLDLNSEESNESGVEAEADLQVDTDQIPDQIILPESDDSEDTDSSNSDQFLEIPDWMTQFENSLGVLGEGFYPELTPAEDPEEDTSTSTDEQTEEASVDKEISEEELDEFAQLLEEYQEALELALEDERASEEERGLFEDRLELVGSYLERIEKVSIESEPETQDEVETENTDENALGTYIFAAVAIILLIAVAVLVTILVTRKKPQE
ncbi:MAG: hypothetical protein GF349_00550 [Candidatus Magasanikbacteria bacterium]|nr:hypothetical protein [Candidatus Magasanikbacteria bacterium]